MKRTLVFVAIAAVLVLAALGWSVMTQGPDDGPRAAQSDADAIVSVAGAHVRVRQEGPPEAPVIVLVHGFTFSLESWDAVAADLAQDYRVIRYDLLGHGLTGPDPQKRYAPQERAEFLLELMTALGVEQAAVIGHSLGGIVSWRFAASHPDRVSQLVLIAGPAFDFSGVADEPGAPPAPLRMHLMNPTRFGVNAMAGVFYADPDRIPNTRFDEIVTMMSAEGVGQASLDHLAEFTMPDPTEALARITAPTLILWGENDALIPVSHAERVRAALSDARVVTYRDVGHVVHEEAPGRVLPDIRAFLDPATP